MYCCSAQESKMDYKRRFLLGGSKQKAQQQQHQQYPLPELAELSAPRSGPPAPPQPRWRLAFLTDLFGSVFRNSRYSKAAMQLKDVQEHVMEAAGRLTAAIKPEIAKMLMELSAGAANFKDQNDFSLQDVEVLGRCFLTVMQVHFQFLSQALQKVQPVAQSCLAEALAQMQERCSGARSQPGALGELDEAARSWKGAAEATARLRERGRDGCLAGFQVQQLFCSHSPSLPDQQLKELNLKINSALQAYRSALDSLGHCEYALKGGFHLKPKSIEAALQGCCSEAEAQQAGRMQTTSQPLQCELPTIPLQIGSHFLKGVSFNESAADNLKLKTRTMLQLIKEASGQNGVSAHDDSPVTEVLNLVCPSTWRGACKTAVQLLFGQAGLVVVDTAQIENKEAYAPQITLEGSRVVVQVPSTWCLKEDPATMSLLQRSLDPEKTLGLVDVLYTTVFDLNRWKERKEQALPTIQIQLQRDSSDYTVPVDLHPCNSSKSSSGLPKTISKLTSKFTKKASSSSGSGGSFSIPSTPSRSTSGIDDKPKAPSQIHQMTVSGPGDSNQHAANGSTPEEQGMNLPTDQEMQDVIDFLSGFNMGKSQQASPLVKRRNSVASSNAADLKPPASVAPPTSQAPVLHAAISLAQNLPQQPQHQQQQQQPPPTLPTTPKQQQQTTVPPQPQAPVQPSPSPQTLQFYQHLLQQSQQPSPVSPQLPSQQPQPLPPQQRAPGKWPQAPPGGLSPIGHMTQWTLPDLSSDLYSLGLVSTYMDSVMSEVLGHKVPPGPRNNTWPNREQSEQGMFGVLGDTMPFDPAVGSDPEFARYVAGVNQAMQQKRQAQHVRRPSNPRSNWPLPDDQHRTWSHPEYYSEGEAVNSTWSTNQGDSASSSDETSSANGDSLFSMFSGPDLVAAVKPRRKHSCGEPEVCTLPSPPLHHAGDDNQDSKTKTWPPKAPWQHSTHSNTMPNPSSSLYQMTIPSSQWGESMQMLQSPVWSTANECSPSSGLSSGFPFTQQQQQQQTSQHKALSKGFKNFPLKPEHRPSYLHQY
ncbi:hypothetical protein HF521_003589 [Silurus meridionalis]|uniref:DUF4745 domain-containing protein n=1 Tax=Silurus meridionalis TaxID=175797 RepID=A0A8T0AYS8_SILME|nr:hypothetical protein HF521_003589 [Silurus meridionalis]